MHHYAYFGYPAPSVFIPSTAGFYVNYCKHAYFFRLSISTFMLSSSFIISSVLASVSLTSSFFILHTNSHTSSTSLVFIGYGRYVLLSECNSSELLFSLKILL